MDITSIPEIIVNEYSTQQVLSLLQSVLSTVKQSAASKEPDKAFLLGKVLTMTTFSVSLVDALRKKLDPKSEGKPPVVAG